MAEQIPSIEELQKAVKQADALAQQKSNFLATMSHEIRTPMQTIYGLLELIANEKPTEKIDSMVKTAQSAASGLLEILDDILDIAKMDADAMELDKFDVPVRLLVRGLLEALSVRTRGVKVSLKDDIESDVPFVISGDPKRLRQILMNLCSNALKFTHDGTVTVRVTKKTKAIKNTPKRLVLRFEVIDTGIGMDKEVSDKLFQAFTQADNSTSRKYGGTGLGLSIAKKLVELMGGKIGVTSKKGKGSTFWFEIPTHEVSTDVNTVDLPKLEGISVLSVEDHPQGAKEIMNSLRSMGAKIETCGTYAEGLALAKRQPFDVGVIDQGLPDGMGLDLIRELMLLRPSMGFVMYTVRDDIGLSHSLHSLGATFLTKPASRAGLGDAVKNAARKNAGLIVDGPTRLLIAEDTESVRDILRRQLEILGVEADFVENGEEALKALKTGKYGIMFTDLHMPELDGYGLVEKIRNIEQSNGKHFPVIVLTADVHMSNRETYMRYGFDECLLKPVTLGQLKRLLIRWHLLEQEEQIPEEPKPVFASLIKPVASEPVIELEIEKEPEPPANAIPTKPAVDRDSLIAHMGKIDKMTIQMMNMFVDMTRPLVSKINESYRAKNFDALKEAAHSLKGSARSACCMVLGDFAATLQEDAAQRKNTCETLVTSITAEFKRVEDEVKNMKA